MRILVFGDSITWGAWDTEGGWVSRLGKEFNKQAIESDLENYQSIYNLGISGDNTEDLLERFPLEAKVRADIDHDVIIIFAIGINDSQYEIATGEHRVSPEKFKENLSKLVRNAKQFSSRIACIGLTPVQDKKLDPMPWKQTHGYKLEFVREYDLLIQKIAQEENVQYISILDLFPNNLQDYLIDGLHPNSEGHKKVAEIIKRRLNLA